MGRRSLRSSTLYMFAEEKRQGRETSGLTRPSAQSSLQRTGPPGHPRKGAVCREADAGPVRISCGFGKTYVMGDEFLETMGSLTPTFRLLDFARVPSSPPDSRCSAVRRWVGRLVSCVWAGREAACPCEFGGWKRRTSNICYSSVHPQPSQDKVKRAPFIPSWCSLSVCQVPAGHDSGLGSRLL